VVVAENERTITGLQGALCLLTKQPTGGPHRQTRVCPSHRHPCAPSRASQGRGRFSWKVAYIRSWSRCPRQPSAWTRSPSPSSPKRVGTESGRSENAQTPHSPMRTSPLVDHPWKIQRSTLHRQSSRGDPNPTPEARANSRICDAPLSNNPLTLLDTFRAFHERDFCVEIRPNSEREVASEIKTLRKESGRVPLQRERRRQRTRGNGGRGRPPGSSPPPRGVANSGGQWRNQEFSVGGAGSTNIIDISPIIFNLQHSIIDTFLISSRMENNA
jgi:hypothetical protein